MALTKAAATIDEWAAITAATSREGATYDISGAYRATLTVAVARIEAEGHALGAHVVVEVRFGSTDEDWRVLTKFRGSAGTVSAIDVDAQSLGGGTTLYVSSTTNFETLFDKYFVKDGAAIGDSEIVRNNGFANDDYITCLDNLTHTHENTADVYTGVDEWVIGLPDDASAVRVLVHNDDADCDIASRTDITKITALT